ncbi:hypothetical protein BN1012_Phect2807 [Candidatus Phaeomarinobacter ectocarpi]|uniref:Uncharacterized protein n=1 Tax=Candidatus Phaeomarinibacter ectocarpi TaxID=1458461 RepID=X5MN63_9HYPH|nr:hypothetical protein BN1012_Phect2807 [Candidatus Phaeomarinobacter ectocarpi]
MPNAIPDAKAKGARSFAGTLNACRKRLPIGFACATCAPARFAAHYAP